MGNNKIDKNMILEMTSTTGQTMTLEETIQYYEQIMYDDLLTPSIQIVQLANWLKQLSLFLKLKESHSNQDIDDMLISKLADKRTNFILDSAIKEKVIGTQCYILGFNDAMNHYKDSNYITKILLNTEDEA